MPRYQAQSPSLFGNVGGPRPPSDQIDVGGALDALTQGATSLIQAAVLRKQAKNQMEMQRQTLERGAARDKAEQTFRERELTLREQEQQRRNAESGYVPESYDVGAPATRQVPITPITRAIIGERAGPQVTLTPPTAPADPRAASATITDGTTVTQEPGHFDPAKSTSVLRTQVSAQAATQRQHERLATQAAIAEAARLSREKIAAMQEAGRNGRAKEGGSAVSRAMTGGQREQAAKEAAIGIMTAAGGSLDAAKEYLDSPEGAQAAKELGIGDRHLLYARARFLGGMTNQVLKMQSSGGMEPGEAVGAVAGAQAAVDSAATANGKRLTARAGGPGGVTLEGKAPSGTKAAATDTAALRRRIEAAYQAAIKANPANAAKAKTLRDKALQNLSAPSR